MDPTKVRYGIDQQYNSASSQYAPTPALDASHKITKKVIPPTPTPPGPNPKPPAPTPTPPKPENKTMIYILAGVGGLFVLCIIVTCCISQRKKKTPTFRMFSDADGLKGVI